ncbi:hypothetical protein AJ87_19925 [Rhizobium yanglingense]|nr:hypothetical protein AJ87_19925 [Rhizobium yanglingense]
MTLHPKVGGHSQNPDEEIIGFDLALRGPRWQQKSDMQGASALDPSLDRQRFASKEAGCEKIHTDKVSGGPVLKPGVLRCCAK